MCLHNARLEKSPSVKAFLISSVVYTPTIALSFSLVCSKSAHLAQLGKVSLLTSLIYMATMGDVDLMEAKFLLWQYQNNQKHFPC